MGVVDTGIFPAVSSQDAGGGARYKLPHWTCFRVVGAEGDLEVVMRSCVLSKILETVFCFGFCHHGLSSLQGQRQGGHKPIPTSIPPLGF